MILYPLKTCYNVGRSGRAVVKSLLPPAAAGRKDEARTPRAPAEGEALCTPISTRRISDLAAGRKDEARTPRAPAEGEALCTPISTRRIPDLATTLVDQANCLPHPNKEEKSII